MDSILETLYMHHFRPDEADQARKQTISEEYTPMRDQIVSTFGIDFLDRFLLLRTQLEHIDEFSAFRQGVSLGAHLMLDVFIPES